ncbi:MAG: hypothetical protein AAF213_00640, partial [Pseudomonadota bacterium]
MSSGWRHLMIGVVSVTGLLVVVELFMGHQLARGYNAGASAVVLSVRAVTMCAPPVLKVSIC